MDEKLILTLPSSVPDGEFFVTEILAFIGVILLALSGLLIVLLGKKCLKTMIFLIFGAGCAAAGYQISLLVAPQKEIHLIFFMMFAVVGWGFLAAVSSLCVYFNKKLRIQSVLSAIAPYFAAFFGAAIVFVALYFFIYRDLILDIAVGVGLLIIGCVIGAIRKKKSHDFYTYEDLLRVPVSEGKQNA